MALCLKNLATVNKKAKKIQFRFLEIFSLKFVFLNVLCQVMSQNFHIDHSYLDRIWSKVASLRWRLFQDEKDAGVSVRKTFWQSKNPDEKRQIVLEAVEEIILFQMKSFIQVMSARLSFNHI